MTYFKLWPNEKFAQTIGATPADDRKTRWFDPLMGDPLPPPALWKPPQLVQFQGTGKNKRKPKPLGDFPSAGLAMLVSQAAVDRLAPELERHANLYPVAIEGSAQSYFLLEVTTVIDAIDRTRSKGKHKKYGNPEHFVVLEEWVFRDADIGDTPIFILPDSPTCAYVSPQFMKKILASGLKGFCFKRTFWDDEPIRS